MLFFTEESAKQILKELKEGKEEIEGSFDLGRSRTKIKREELENIPLEKIKGNAVYFWNDELYKAAISSDHYFQLNGKWTPPILEIDGVRMHLTKFKNTLEYSRKVCKKLKINRNDVVLDSCMGLGYSAITASLKAKKVITIEKNEEVFELAKINPWSKELFENKNIEIMKGDAFEIVERIKNITKIIHDPPRFSLAGQLYSLSFYEKLYRASTEKAKLFHYVGEVGKGRGRRIMDEIKNRLEIAGWKVVEKNKELEGVFAIKRKV